MLYVSERIVYGIFLDTETTGLDPYIHSILEIAFIVVDLGKGEKVSSFESLIRVSMDEWKDSDPKSLEYVGLHFEDLASGVQIRQVQEKIENILIQLKVDRKNAVFICQNPSFDRPFFSKIIPPYRQEELSLPYHWLDLASMYWAVYKSKQMRDKKTVFSLSKDSIAQEFGLPPEEKPHRAMNGAKHLLLCYEKIVGYNTNPQK
jgi:oligoribonuclease